jgi:F0F1-type ATP synthase assembly protein I
MVALDPQPENHDEVEQALGLGRYAGLGFQFAGALVAFGALGWWLDGLLGTSPWLLIAGVFIGAAGAFVALLRAVPAARARSTNLTSSSAARNSRQRDLP